MSAASTVELFLIHLHLSLLSVGGAMTVAPDLHRVLVDQQGWISNAAFTRAITLAQAMPGPNVLYIALLGWQTGLSSTAAHAGAQAGALMAGLSGLRGLGASLLGVLLPSSILACAAARLQQRWSGHRVVQAFRAGMAPVVVAAMLGSAWVIARGAGIPANGWLAPVLALLTTVAVACSRVHLLWLLLAGALTGALAGITGIGLS